MVFVKVRDGETLEDTLRRFKRDCERNGVLKEMRRRERYTPPSVRRKLKEQELLRKIRRGKRRRAAR